MRRIRLVLPLLFCGLGTSLPLAANDIVHQQRQMMMDANPAEHWEWRGEQLFHENRGPKNASLESCDFGLGPGVLEGAHAQLPRWFADAGQVMDLETRIVWCMKTLQGFEDSDPPIARKHTSSVDGSDLVAIATYVGSHSQGMRWNTPLDHPMEKAMRDAGEEIFYRRSGKWDMSCQTCHGQSGKRVRQQTMYDINSPEQVAVAISWPAYRIGHATVRTDQHRLRGCYYQMRHPGLTWGSPTAIALLAYLRDQARGGPVLTPHLKR